MTTAVPTQQKAKKAAPLSGERSNAALAGTIETELSKVGAVLTGRAMEWIIQKGGARPLPFGR